MKCHFNQLKLNFRPLPKTDTVKIPKREDLAIFGNEHKKEVLKRWLRRYENKHS